MIGKLHGWAQKLRGFLNTEEWLIRLLRLKSENNGASTPGLVMIQLDGLSYANCEKAMREGYLPFIKKLSERERYRFWHHYSGVPSSTPAVQGEIFYGVKQCVPAFKYRDHA